MVKNLPAIQETQETETWVPSLSQEDLLEEETATHSSNLAWEIPWTEALVATVHGVAKSGMTEQLSTFTVIPKHFRL